MVYGELLYLVFFLLPVAEMSKICLLSKALETRTVASLLMKGNFPIASEAHDMQMKGLVEHFGLGLESYSCGSWINAIFFHESS